MQEEKLHKDDLAEQQPEDGQKEEESTERQATEEASQEVKEEEKDDSAALLEAKTKELEAKAKELEAKTKELDVKTREYEELVNRYQRLLADFENYKRRSRKELEDMAKYGAERLILGLLPVLDNFSRALAAAPQEGEAGKFMSGIDMIYRQCLTVLQNEGLKAIEAVGQPFDPEKHHAVMQAETQNPEEDNLVTEELQVGYTLNDKVIRPSMVKVAKYNG